MIKPRVHPFDVSKPRVYITGDSGASEAFTLKAENLAEAIRDILWDEEERMWFDFDFLNNVRHFSFRW